MKRKKTLNKLAALLLSAVMALSLNTAVLAAETNRHAAIDKTAAELKDGRTDVTLAIGAGSEKTSSDVVCVLDKSTSVEVKDAALAMLDELMTRAGENRIKVGVVEFNKTADNEGFVLPLTSLNPDSYAQVEAIFKNELKSGTNIDAGIRAGAAMLAADTSVDNSSKHLVLVTDGVTYMWGDTPTTVFNEVSPDNISRIWSSPSVCGFYPIGKDAAPYANAGQWMADNAAALEKVIENYQQPYGEYQEGAPYITLGSPYTCCDAAIYMAGKAWQNAVDAGYQCYAYADPRYADEYPWAPGFISSLCTIGGVSGMVPADTAGMFDQVKSRILYTIQNGMVTDVIGSSFDLDSLSSLRMSVGDTALTGTVDEAAGTVVFTNGGDRYTVTYTKDESGQEVLAWAIDAPVVSGVPISLTYTLKLSEKETEPGTYTVPTNESAVLDYISTDGEKGREVFPVPTVSYTVAGGEASGAPENPSNPETGSGSPLLWGLLVILVFSGSCGAIFFLGKKKPA